MVKTGIPSSVSKEAVGRVSQKAGLKWASVQRKGTLTKKDLKLRLTFARKVRRKLFVNVWVEGVEIDLVGVSFTQKINLFKRARTPKAMAWKRPGQGFDFGFTGKGSQKDTGGTVAQFMTVIAYGKGESGAEQYHGRINAKRFSSFVRDYFASMFK